MRTKSLLRTLSLALGLVFSTFVQMQAQNCNGATITTTDGATRVYTCPGDGQDDILSFTNTSTAGTDYAYAITDANNYILTISEDGNQNFEGAGVGNCRVWGFSYTGEILAKAGESVFSTQFSNGCWAISSTAIEVIRDVPDGGTVFMPSGRTERVVCTTDSYPDVVIFRHTTSSTATYRYVITDDQNNILGLPPGDNLDFEGVPSGVCRVWGLSYTGDIVASVGQNAATSALSDGCFELSENFIEVTRTDVDGGTVATADGSTEVNTIPGDGIDDIISFTHTTGSSSSYGYVITDNNNKVLGVPGGNSQNFEGAGEGVCLVWGISYTGDLSIYPGDDLLDKALSTGCFDLSANVITVNRSEENTCEADAGSITFEDGSTETSICVDGNADPLNVTVTGGTGTNRGWVITDTEGNILGLPAAPPFDLDGAGTGTCLIWYLRYEDGFSGAAVGNNASDLEGCFDLSNPITVYREAPDGGTVSLLDGSTSYTGTAGDIVVQVQHETESPNLSYWYIVTDDNDNILAYRNSATGNTLDLSGAPAGVCRIWGWNYRGLPNPIMGENISTLNDDDCEEISENFITVIREEPAQIDQIVINEISADGTVELRNTGSNTVDISSYWLCDLPDYDRLSDLDIVCGSLMLEPGEIVAVNGLLDISISANSGELGLYINSSFGSSDAIVDYVQWGTAGGGRSGVAINAGIWTAGDVVPSFTDEEAIAYDGTGDSSSDWEAGEATICEENSNGFLTSSTRNSDARLESAAIRLYPNPVYSQLTVDTGLEKAMDEESQISIYSVTGQLMEQYESTDIKFELNVNGFAPGLYLLQIRNGSQVVTKKFTKH